MIRIDYKIKAKYDQLWGTCVPGTLTGESGLE
jgi:hypothetical protein